MIPRHLLDEVVRRALDDDLAGGDVTTESVGKWLPWLWAVAAGGGVAGTALWYLSA